jgi:hypothetical protein
VGLPPERIWSDAFFPIQIYVAEYYLICHASYHMRRLIGWARISAWSRFYRAESNTEFLLFSNNTA